MKRLVAMQRCRCPGCAAVPYRRVLAVVAVCIAIPAGWKLLLEDYEFVSRTDESLVGAREEQSDRGFDKYSAADQSQELGWPQSSRQLATPHRSEAQNGSANPRLASERFNAALAAGLIDPPKIDLIEPLVEAPTPEHQPVLSLSGPVPGMQNREGGVKQEAPLIAAAVAPPPASSAPYPTKPSEAVFSLDRATDEIVTASSTQSDEREPNGMTIPPHTRGSHRKNPISRNRPFSVRFLERPGINSPGNGSSQKSVSRNNASSNGVETESTIDRRSGDRYPQSRDLSEDLQRFASDFVRTNETDKFAEQHRFFADSVHFYREGDLSLASVEAATRRQHRDQQIKRSEIAGRAIATGPVNGGFFVIEQPVRWTQSQGSKVTHGQSVLQLRVIPVNHGEWKITSIDEVKKQ